MEKMRAFEVLAPGRPFELTRRTVPEPGHGQVRVRVQACGICHSDVFAVSGIPGATYPLIPGHEIAGVIDALGPGVRSWTPGDRVGIGWFGGQCGECESCRRGNFVGCSRLMAPGLQVDGGYADYVVVPVAALARVPDALDPVQVGPVMCAGVTAFNALRKGEASAGSRIAVIGVGGVGHLAIQFANRMGCETIAVSRGTAKQALARRLGAHHFIDASDGSVAEDLSRIGGADVIVATSPSSAELHQLLPGVATQGRIVVTGFISEPVRVSSLDLIARDLRIMGSAAGTSSDAEETLRFCALNGIGPLVEEFALETASDAYAAMVAGTVRFRAVLNTSGSPPRHANGHAKGHTANRHTANEHPPNEHPPNEHTANRHTGNGTRQEQPGAPALVRPGLAGTVLDCPADELPDVDELIQAAMRWHFGQRTGSPFWLERAKSLDFNPVTDVRCLADLRLFPNVVADLRTVAAEDLIPKGYGTAPALLGVFESGGVTGTPKRVVLLRDWLDRWMVWAQRTSAWGRDYPEKLQFKTGTVPRFLLVAPTGPHLVTYLMAEAARELGGTVFTIDLDPRWVRKRATQGHQEEVGMYAEHLLEQATDILTTQNVNILTITPPLLERIALRPRLADLVRQKISLISWGGTHMDADTLRLYRTEIFPGITLQGGYGSTMVLGGSVERAGLADDDLCVFDTFPPYVTFSVVDPGTREEVPFGQRGQVVMNHVSKSMLLPNNLERDTAIRVRGPIGHAGDSVAEVLPVAAFEGNQVTEGVY